MERSSSALIAVLAAVGVLLLGILVYQNLRIHAEPELTTPYQAVVLNNGQAFFGKLEKAGTQNPVLRDVFYIRSQVNQETKQVANQLVKRGSEPHGPDYMVLNRSTISVIEPVRPESQIGKLIEQASRAATGSTTPPQVQQPPVPQVK